MKKAKKLLIVSGPSGSGKTTLLKHLFATDPHFQFSVSLTTRSLRGNEIQNVDYTSTSEKAFLDYIQKGSLAEWARVHKAYYGTLAAHLDGICSAGLTAVCDVDVQGKKSLSDWCGQQRDWDVFSIFIMPPGISPIGTLRERLLKRGDMTPAEIDGRVKRAREEIAEASTYDRTLVNNDVEVAKRRLTTYARLFRTRAFETF